MIPYAPGWLNLAMFELFALVTAQHGKPQEGQGWRVERVLRTPWGDALFHVLAEHLLSWDFLMRDDCSDEDEFGELQEILQPCLPAWQRNLDVAANAFQGGVYIFKASLGRIWRRIAISGKDTLGRMSDGILHAYAFDHDHLYAFYYKNRFGRKTSIKHPYMDEPPFTTDVRIGDLPLRPGVSMTYVFDFGDYWEFDVNLERIDPAERRMRKYRILESHGEAPEQYPSWDDDGC